MKRGFILPLSMGALFLSFLLTSLNSQAAEDDSKQFWTTASIGANVLSALTNSSLESSIGLEGFLHESYYFTPSVGLTSGLDYMSRGVTSGARSSSAPYLDIPLMMSFGTRGGWLSSSSVSTTNLGLYYALALSNFSGDLGTALGTKSNYLGLVLSTNTLFPVSESFYMGFNVNLKYGLGKAFQGTQSRFVDFGLGLVVGF